MPSPRYSFSLELHCQRVHSSLIATPPECRKTAVAPSSGRLPSAALSWPFPASSDTHAATSSAPPATTTVIYSVQ